jgi:superfamily II DNA or RNA helicase
VVDYTIKGTKAGFTLNDEQQDIVRELLDHRHYFNCAQTGIGKTYSTITAAIRTATKHKGKDLHFVLILPNSAVKAFTDCLGKQIGVPYNVYTATLTRTMDNARFHIFNYGTLSDKLFLDKKGSRKILDDDGNESLTTNRMYEILLNLRREHRNLWLIADEAHALQDTTTNQYMLIKLIRPLFVGIWFLTATPILNSIEGHYNMVDLLIPGFYGTWWRFRNKYCVLSDTEVWAKNRYGKRYKLKTTKSIVGFKNMDHLQSEFAKISIIRAQIYDFEILYRSVKLPSDMHKFYKFAALGLFSGTMSKSGRVKTSKQEASGARLHDLQRVVSNSHPKFALAADRDPRKLTPKEVLLIDTIKEVLSRDEAVLIYFGYHETVDRIRFILEILKEKLRIPNIHEVTGKVPMRARKAVEDAIQPRDVVLMTSAGTESVNLQRANNLIFYEVPFPIREFIQGCGRITRTNSMFNKFRIYILEAIGTIDTYKKNRIMQNSLPIKAVVGGSNILPTEILILNEDDRQAQKDQLLWWK